MSAASYLTYGFMDKIEARLIVDIVKSGSIFFKDPELEYANSDEGTTLRYDPEKELFFLRRYEVGDSELHFYGFDETLILDEKELMDLLTGNTHPPSPAWFEMRESKHYRFYFDAAPPPQKDLSERILESIDPKDLNSLRCTSCHSRQVKPTAYQVSVNIGRAIRYVHMEGDCQDCGEHFVLEWDD